mmetsp:Transcript_32231/g.109536  ORF Transcript_32231/g.109536 Transcript_32231/m.109536 type:complete len:200 (+) Transcript_32231:602-1201(+)
MRPGAASKRQTTAGLPWSASAALTREKQRLFANGRGPRVTESGDGCDVAMTSCVERSTPSQSSSASLPQARKTQKSSRSFSTRTTSRVTISQPFFCWPFLSSSQYVSAAFRRRTSSRRAQFVRSPFHASGGRAKATPRSARNSSKMFCRDLGKTRGRAPAARENARPCAWPGVGYGSWPMMTTLTRLSVHALNAANVSS